jgi:hypothetical protein
MINSIGSGPNGGYLQVNNGYSSQPYVSSPNSNNPVTGMIRMNGSHFEVFDGNSWLAFSGSSAEVSLSGSAISALDWCHKKMAEETRIRELAAKNVTIADALARYELAQEQLKVVLALTDEA